MAQTKLEELGFTLKANGKVDFTNPPKGKKFVPLQVDEEYIKLKEIDTRFVSRKHKFSATSTTVVMEVVDEETEGAGADAYIAFEKAEAKREERKNRCKYINPKTGNETYCPDCISCYGDECPKKRGIQVWKETTECLNDMAEVIKSCSWSDNPVEDDVLTGIMWSDFKKDLRKDVPALADIIEWDEYGYNPEEILEKLGKRKDQKSWYYYQWKRIRDRWVAYNEE